MLAVSIAVALSFWGAPPCSVAYHVEALEPNVLGVASVQGDGSCEVRIASRRWKFWELCAVLTHEVGHLHGQPHSDDRLSVMYPVLWRPADPCRGKRPPWFPRGAVIDLS